MSERHQCCYENDRIVDSENTAADPQSCKRNAQGVAKAEADCEVECIDMADVLAGRIRHGAMCCSRLAEIRGLIIQESTIDCR